MSAYPLIDISIEPIELCKLLKIANMVGGGGEAKIVISEGYVLVNNEVEFQKRKKIRHGDIVEFDGEVVQVAYKPKQKSSKHAQSNDAVTKSPIKKSKSKANETLVSAEQALEPTPSTAKRRPISF
ncbi:RNA-binding S4 domain-containing protein [Colwellia hornerae]|uniref:RNA-binding S4 domain-containing protein n=1 Tax=Colwellia hornerae TaxID=89402 RepID=A0A5C6QQS6_9GAMM|nr:RNA-binding S4 domain-containing protein [Colwellia hornerae]TWX55667.1 RNA-binding S4 domain-containing protein [Colwellia hornerae]TWX61877.1 RNA-binding S4 domain-containing protein [Colwellia hornerae]TWX71209.1 RNA-binding S4 domain-containing protein [Colwellia hornerae]